MNKLILGALLFSLSSLSTAGVMCSGGYSGNVSDTLGCELGTTNNDFISPNVQVNDDALFGETEWELIFRSGSSENEGQTTVFNVIMYDNEYGSFSIDWTDWESILFVQKDGNGDPNTYVGWLLDPTTSYDFLTPFTNTVTGGYKDISHLTWYGVPNDGGVNINKVPSPAPLALMGFGLLFLRKRVLGV